MSEKTQFDARKTSDQEFRDWGGTHLAVYVGRRAVCNRSVYNERDQHEDGTFGDAYNPDWRGIIGEHSCDSLIAEQYGYTGEDVNLCAVCSETEPLYKRGLEIAKSKWQSVDLDSTAWDIVEDGLTPEQ